MKVGFHNVIRMNRSKCPVEPSSERISVNFSYISERKCYLSILENSSQFEGWNFHHSQTKADLIVSTWLIVWRSCSNKSFNLCRKIILCENFCEVREYFYLNFAFSVCNSGCFSRFARINRNFLNFIGLALFNNL